MPTLTLDGFSRAYKDAPDGFTVALSISKSLAKKAVALRVDGEMWDLARTITKDAVVEVITRDTPAGLELLRHDAAHVMAEAVQELFDGTQVTIGPVIKDGFYYDFACKIPFQTQDLEKIEERMREIVARDEKISREVWTRKDAISYFLEIGERYKAQIIEDLSETEEITVYRQGNWLDLCRGPHLPSTGKLGTAFKLLKVAGAYWRGDSRNEMLQRIYGTAWATHKELKNYLQMLEEAEKRDHRRLGRQMGLYHFSQEAPGSAFWHPRGWTVFCLLTDYLRERQAKAGYEEINTPDMMHLSLWERSGHWEKFGENMFTSQTEDGRQHALKPMNCPGHVEIFSASQKSYRDLPLRFSEFGKVHRYEPSGALHGLLRVRHFTQDDAHIFCTREQIEEECAVVTTLILDIYKDFGFRDVRINFADRPRLRVGSDEIWSEAEKSLEAAARSAGVEFSYLAGEGAFYGPKLEFVLRDAIGRDWQCGTVQLDFNLPGRLGASYIDKNGDKKPPVMIHRALFGSLERFLGILVEHHAGALPFWLSPVQVVVAPITNTWDEYAKKVYEAFKSAGVRVETDLRNQKINYKVREHSVAKIPAIGVVGEKEAKEGQVSLRWLRGKDKEILTLEKAVERLRLRSELFG